MNTVTPVFDIMNNLSSLKPGDKVIEHIRSLGSRSRLISTVERVTTTLIITNRETRYRIKDGYPPAASAWNVDHIEPATPESIKKVAEENEKARIINDLKAAQWSRLSIEELRLVKAAIPARIMGD